MSRMRLFSFLLAITTITTWACGALAEYTTFAATCQVMNSNADAGGNKIQIWFTFRSQVGTSLEPNPKQAVYRLVFIDAAGNSSGNDVIVNRGTPDLDATTADKQLAYVELKSQDNQHLMQLTLNQDNVGNSTGVAVGRYLFSPSGTPAQTYAIQCSNLGAGLFKP